MSVSYYCIPKGSVWGAFVAVSEERFLRGFFSLFFFPCRAWLQITWTLKLHFIHDHNLSLPIPFFKRKSLGIFPAGKKNPEG